jgi:hypothetical protein
MAREDYEELLLPYQDSDLEGLLTSHTRKILLGGDYEIHIIRTNLASAISNGWVRLPLSTISIFGRVKIRPLDGKDKEESSVGSNHTNEFCLCDQQWSGDDRHAAVFP